MTNDEDHRQQGPSDEFTEWRLRKVGRKNETGDPTRLVSVSMGEAETKALMNMVSGMPGLSEAAALKSAAMIGAQLLKAAVELFDQGLHVKRQEIDWLKADKKGQAKIGAHVWEQSLKAVALESQAHVESIIAKYRQADAHEPAVGEAEEG